MSRAFRLAAGAEPPANPVPFGVAGPDPGLIDKRVILQVTWWVDVRAVRHRLTEMTPDYRANVLAHLEQEAPTWVRQAHAWTLYEAITSVITVADATDRLDMLDWLTPGWIQHTPLGLRLHELNGTTPEPLAAPAAVTTAAESDCPDVLRDHDRGLWQITTESTSRYLIDLDRRRIQRQPGQPSTEPPVLSSNGDGPRTAGASRPPVSTLDYDGEWTGLDGIVDCRVGRGLVVLDHRLAGPGYRLSTTITRIQRLSEQHSSDHVATT